MINIASEVVEREREKIIKFKLLITYLCTQRVNYLTPPQTTPPSGSAHIFLWGVNDIPTICNENENDEGEKSDNHAILNIYRHNTHLTSHITSYGCSLKLSSSSNKAHSHSDFRWLSKFYGVVGNKKNRKSCHRMVLFQGIETRLKWLSYFFFIYKSKIWKWISRSRSLHLYLSFHHVRLWVISALGAIKYFHFD